MKTMYSPGYHHNGFVSAHAIGHSLVLLGTHALEHSLFHWYQQQCVTVHHVPKCMSCHKAIVVITGRAHCFHDWIYITPISFL